MRRGQKLGRDPLDLFRQRRGEEERLPPARQRAHDLAHVRKEAHVQHAFGFIQDHDFDLREVDEASSHQIEQTARRGDDDLDTRSQRVDLRVFADSSIHRRAAKASMPAVIADVLFNLQHELACRSDDERAHTFAAHLRSMRGQPMENREDECGGLPRSGLGDPDDIVTGEDQRDGLALDWSRFGVAGLAHRFREIGAEA